MAKGLVTRGGRYCQSKGGETEEKGKWIGEAAPGEVNEGRERDAFVKWERKERTLLGGYLGR